MSSNRILSHSFHCYDLFLLLPECKVPDFLIAFYENTFHSGRSEEHTSELQSQSNLVCRLLLEKKKQLLTPSSTSNKHPAFLRLPARQAEAWCAYPSHRSALRLIDVVRVIPSTPVWSSGPRAAS